jgi:hypothetical protein
MNLGIIFFANQDKNIKEIRKRAGKFAFINEMVV